MTEGVLYGVGVGPGDPDLITVKAMKLLQRVPVVAWPAPLEGESLARRIAAPHLPEGAIEIPIRMPMVEARFPAEQVYDAAAEQISEHLTAGRDVAVLCEGDPFFYGSFMYLFARMTERHRVEVIPGVSSLTASAAMTGAPLASRNDVLTVLPAPLPEEDLSRRLKAADAVAFIKVGRHFDKVLRLLDAEGMADSALYIQHATMEKQMILPLRDAPAAAVPYFSMILAHRRGDAWRKPEDGTRTPLTAVAGGRS